MGVQTILQISDNLIFLLFMHFSIYEKLLSILFTHDLYVPKGKLLYQMVVNICKDLCDE